MVALGDRLIEGMDPGVIPGLVAIDQGAGAPRLVADMQGGIAAVERDWTPAVEGQRQTAVIVELALDDDPTLVGDEPRGRQSRAGLPVEGEAVLVRERAAGARVPLTVQLDGTGGADKQRAVAGEDGEGTGLLVGERL
jgi:hypothetical protein